MILVTVRSKLSDMDILFQIMHWNEDNTGVVALHRENMETEARLSAQEEILTSKFRETADRTRTNSHIRSRVKTDLVSRECLREVFLFRLVITDHKISGMNLMPFRLQLYLSL